MDSCDEQDFKIQNMVASCDVKFPIRLEGLAMTCGLFANVSPICSIWSMVLKFILKFKTCDTSAIH
jgi:hypothetical protein